MNELPLICDIDDRHKVTLVIQGDQLYYKAEFLMDSQEWVITESYGLSKERAGWLAFAILGKADEMEGPKLKRPRRARNER